MPGRGVDELYLVDYDDIEFDLDNMTYRIKSKMSKGKKIALIIFVVFCILTLVAVVFAFIIIPLVFMNVISLQQDLIFTHSNLPQLRQYYEDFPFPGYKNHYITVKDINTNANLELGLWHILPLNLAVDALNSTDYDYDEALLNSTYSVLIYFHGTGEDRSQSIRKYQLLRIFFHIIVFDYRCYADSDCDDLFEKNVVYDSVQIYNWVKNHTNNPIYIWGHSLGTSLATNTLSQIKDNNVSGLILEAPFTSLQDELYVHPYVKYLAWLPWFKATIINPLERNGFIFDTYKYIQSIHCPIMFLHAKDDEVVPYTMSEQLYNITREKGSENYVYLHLFNASQHLNHFFIYQDANTIFFIMNFMKLQKLNLYKDGSHQS